MISDETKSAIIARCRNDVFWYEDLAEEFNLTEDEVEQVVHDNWDKIKKARYGHITPGSYEPSPTDDSRLERMIDDAGRDYATRGSHHVDS